MSDVSLRDYVERIFEEHGVARRAELASAQKTMEVTADALREKLTEMNQFRIQLERERALYVQNKDLDPLSERIRKLEERGANLDGRFWALGVGLTLLMTVMNLALRFLVGPH